MNFNWSVIIPGAVISTLITAIAMLLGKLISKSSVISTANIEDRGKFTRDLLRRVETMEAEISALRKRETKVIQIVSFLGGEMRVLSGLVGQLISDLQSDPLDQKDLLGQSRTIKQNIDKVSNRLDKEVDAFINDQQIMQFVREHQTDEFTIKASDRPD